MKLFLNLCYFNVAFSSVRFWSLAILILDAAICCLWKRSFTRYTKQAWDAVSFSTFLWQLQFLSFLYDSFSWRAFSSLSYWKCLFLFLLRCDFFPLSEFVKDGVPGQSLRTFSVDQSSFFTHLSTSMIPIIFLMIWT